MKHSTRILSPSLLATLCAIALAGCTVGPDFHPPAVPAHGNYSAQPLTAPPGVAFEYGGAIAADWYHLLGSPQVNTLVREALAHNPSLDAARASVAEARAELRAVNGGRWPQLTGRALANRAHLNPAALGFPGGGRANNDSFAGLLQLSYNLDVFGRLQRHLEAQGAAVAHERAAADAAYINLVNQVVATALDAATAQSMLDETQSLVDAQQRQLRIIKLQEQVGTVGRAQSLTAQAQIESTQATLPALRQRLAAAQASLAALVGTTPAQFQAPHLTLANFHMPANLPVSLPSQLIVQRPDILAAQALLHAASAKVGLAIAARLPSFSLSADYGALSDRGVDFFNASNALWVLGGNITAPLFDGGTLSAKEDAAKAALKQAEAQYRLTVLNAFAEVATALHALDNDSASLAAHDRALKTAREALHLSDLEFRTGTVDELQVLTTQQQYRSELLKRIRAEQRRDADVATLIHALGGGWWNRPPTHATTGSAPSSHGAAAAVRPALRATHG
ncbi:MAG TPA: efflux transporter outer membrane subunit [Nevskiaceae bacterium]|nr:efflux transporter outer membrane subunit [Nevskiaceae bacterium]